MSQIYDYINRLRQHCRELPEEMKWCNDQYRFLMLAKSAVRLCKTIECSELVYMFEHLSEHSEHSWKRRYSLAALEAIFTPDF